MASFSKQKFFGMCARVAGSKNPVTGEQHGGVFYPACTKNGKHQNARFETTIALNRRDYVDPTGQKHEGKADYIKMVAFNSAESKPGHGMADMLAKAITPGKEITIEGELRSGPKRLFVNGVPITDAAGNQIEYTAHNILLTDMPLYGADSDKVIAAEAAAYAGQPSFNSRPACWNLVNHVDKTTWQTIVAPWRNAQTWKGEPTFGYARVIVPEGAVVDPAYGAVTGPIPGAAPTDAAAQLASMMALLQQLQGTTTTPPAMTPQQQALAAAKALIAANASGSEEVPF